MLLSHAQKAREEADYFPEVSFTEEVAKERLDEVERFIGVAGQHLSKNGLGEL